MGNLACQLPAGWWSFVQFFSTQFPLNWVFSAHWLESWNPVQSSLQITTSWSEHNPRLRVYRVGRTWALRCFELNASISMLMFIFIMLNANVEHLLFLIIFHVKPSQTLLQVILKDAKRFDANFMASHPVIVSDSPSHKPLLLHRRPRFQRTWSD